MSDGVKRELIPTKVELGAYAVHDCFDCDNVHLQVAGPPRVLKAIREDGKEIMMATTTGQPISMGAFLKVLNGTPRLELVLQPDEARAFAAEILRIVEQLATRHAEARLVATDLVKGAQQP
jgi:hypothetical protein